MLSAVPETPRFVLTVGEPHVASPRRKSWLCPAAGAGANPACPAALDVAAVIFPGLFVEIRIGA